MPPDELPDRLARRHHRHRQPHPRRAAAPPVDVRHRRRPGRRAERRAPLRPVAAGRRLAAWHPTFGHVESDRGLDQAQVRERLREVSEQLAGRRIDLLGEQADVVAVARGAARRARAPSPPRLRARSTRRARTSRSGRRPRLLRRRPSRRSRSDARTRPSASSFETSSIVAFARGSSNSTKPTIGISRLAASARPSSPKYWRNAFVSGSTPSWSTALRIAAQAFFQLSRSPSRSSAVAIGASGRARPRP